MKKNTHFLLLMISVNLVLVHDVMAQPGTQAGITIVPKPLYLEQRSGNFVLDNETRILVSGEDRDLTAIGNQLADELEKLVGIRPDVGVAASPHAKNSIFLGLETDTLGDEGYRLTVSADRVSARGSKPAGVFYATQSILQLLPTAHGGAATALPAVEIADKPRFGWRGLMLDVGRYFYSVEYIKKYIDYLAMHKMNTFHWHLTEDHGWRIEIKKYPRLTSVGAWRAGTQFACGDRVDHTPHGGFYTQDQVREIVAYAQARYVTVVPEIEMPGHTYAALVAYPELSCTGEPAEMLINWGIQEDIYCGGKEEVFVFLENVLSEVAALFPSEFIHIGGDEAPKKRWEACSHCQKRIQDEGLEDEHELQSYFITRIERFLRTKGKRIIGWDEILEGGLAPNAAVMSWRGIEGGIEAARMHHPVVMTPHTHMYFDYYQGEPYLEPFAIGGYLPLQKVYGYEPIPDELSKEEANFILGVQGNVWAEYIHSPDYADYMTFPRVAALAEVAWTERRLKDWDDFIRRMEAQYVRYEQRGIKYAQSAFNVLYDVRRDAVGSGATVSLSTHTFQPDIRYTVDGTEPTASATSYEKPFAIAAPCTVKAATFKNGIRINKVSSYSLIGSER